jgi:hypothetical protein
MQMSMGIECKSTQALPNWYFEYGMGFWPDEADTFILARSSPGLPEDRPPTRLSINRPFIKQGLFRSESHAHTDDIWPRGHA